MHVRFLRSMEPGDHFELVQTVKDVHPAHRPASKSGPPPLTVMHSTNVSSLSTVFPIHSPHPSIVTGAIQETGQDGPYVSVSRCSCYEWYPGAAGNLRRHAARHHSKGPTEERAEN